MSNLNLKLIISAIDRASAPIKKVGATLNRLNKMSGLDRVTSGARNVGRELSGVTSQVGRLGLKATALGGILGYTLKKQLVDTAAQFERYRTVLETIEGSSEKADKSLSWVSNFAATTPYEIDQVIESFVKLRSYGIDPTNGLLRTLGDTGAAMGKPIMQAVEAIADAMTGENERLKEFGITAQTKGDKTRFSYTDAAGKQVAKTVDKNNRAMIQSTLEAIWNQKFAGAMEKQSKTWIGMMSNIADQWTQFKILIMQSGVFDWMKEKLEGLLSKINEMAGNGQLKVWAKTVGAELLKGFKMAWEAGAALVGVMQTVGRWLKQLADYFGSWKPIIAVAAAVIAGPLLMALVSATGAIASLGAALLATPVGWFMGAITAISGGAYLIYKNWEPLMNWFSNLWGSLKALFAEGIAGILGGIHDLTKNLPDWALPEGLEPKNLEKSIAAYKQLASPTLAPVDFSMPSLADIKRDLGFNGKPAGAEVGGTLKIQIDSDGKPQVKELRSSGPMDIEVDTGMVMAGV